MLKKYKYNSEKRKSNKIEKRLKKSICLLVIRLKQINNYIIERKQDI